MVPGTEPPKESDGSFLGLGLAGDVLLVGVLFFWPVTLAALLALLWRRRR